MSSINFQAEIEFLKKQADKIDTNLRSWWFNYLIESQRRYSFTLSFIGDCKEDYILEVGSIPCQFTYLLSQRCKELKGVDINPERNKTFIKDNNLDVVKCDIERESLPFPDNYFDKIIFTEVLEHLRINPIFTVKQLARVLKPGGSLILSTPNVSILTKVEFIKGVGYQGDLIKEFEKLEKIGHMGHYRLFDPNEIKCLLDFLDLEILRIDYFGSIPRGITSFILKLFFGNKIKPLIFISAKK